MVIEFENGFTIYFAGDTDVFGDMALIAELSESTWPSCDRRLLHMVRTGPPKQSSSSVSRPSCRCISARSRVGRPAECTPGARRAWVKVLDINPGATI